MVQGSEVRLSGRSISPGLGMGQAWVVGDVLKWSGPPATIGQNDVDGELVRLAHASRKRWPTRSIRKAHRSGVRFHARRDLSAHGEMLRGLASGEFERELELRC